MMFDFACLQISSLWERLLGAIGDAAGGALGRVVEAIRTLFEGDPETRRKVSFSVAIIALSAKMAKADGVVNDAEVRAFRQIFDFPEEEAKNVARLYNLARQDVAGYEAYAERLAGLCGSGHANCEMLESVIDGLFHIAKADGAVTQDELDYLERVSDLFGMSPLSFRRLTATHVGADPDDPYRILDVPADADDAMVHSAWRAAMSEAHPDRARARGLPLEFIEVAEAKSAAINAAFSTVMRERRELAGFATG